jgi:endogenous inhibitor of DNA gyrase (YacG/DUF329 family)
MRKTRCPQCGKESPYTEENPYRPFCSDRCQLIDLGNWADSRYTLPDRESTPPTQDEDNSSDESGESADGRVLH